MMYGTAYVNSRGEAISPQRTHNGGIMQFIVDGNTESAEDIPYPELPDSPPRPAPVRGLTPVEAQAARHTEVNRRLQEDMEARIRNRVETLRDRITAGQNNGDWRLEDFSAAYRYFGSLQRSRYSNVDLERVNKPDPERIRSASIELKVYIQGIMKSTRAKNEFTGEETKRLFKRR